MKKSVLIILLSFIALILHSGLTSKATASLIQWQLNATFENQGSVTPTATGTFTFDDASASMFLQDLNITTTSFWDTWGGDYPRNVYTQGGWSTANVYEDGNLVASIPTLIFSIAHNGLGYPELHLYISHPLSITTPITLSTSAAAYNLNSFEVYMDLYGYIRYRNVISLDLRTVPVPEPATMLLLGLGLMGLVGVAGIRRKFKK